MSTTRTTRERILDVAEELFAERGIGETSLRALTRTAGVNLASVHYHFGSKEALLDAVIERRARPFNELRLKQLDRLEASGNPADVDAILRAFFLPAFRSQEGLGTRRTLLRRLIARIHAQPAEQREELLRRHTSEVNSRFVTALRGALPTLPGDEVADRFRLALGAMLHVFAGNFELDEVPGYPGRALDEAILEQLVSFAAAGLRAPARRGPVR
jgi:AcrR family transcriptional regulator